ncbi:tegument protein [Psittacid alphaherpesvirus 1]|uniref:Capsid vertex component 1 n=39 Tax=Psittacid alphaherpesvirus 1 TaxID=50294 RepID=CVC1_PSHV1|nr:DNA packaging tegument protein UL17 [Psittacid alphaherpesvirus 1]Q6UDI1.1 RecName: Full=Capsid vertex component 1 [Psittacid herpesvirus 1 Amazon parrot/1997]AAQ73729.1 tegument protein [Psittacid alphaherpesvirus 1]
MEAHFVAAAAHSAAFGDRVGGESPYLSHIVLSERCMVNFGVPTFLLASGNNFYAEVQIRFHGCLQCTQWRRVFSVYAPSSAIDRILLPDVSSGNCGRSAPFRIMYDSGNSWGGLFISVPVFCDPEKLTFDGYTAVAVRLAICGSADEFYEMLFTYDELAQPQTRFYADAGRFDALALQICEYHIPAAWPSRRKEEFLNLRGRLLELIAARGSTRQLDKVLRADSYITHEQPLVPDPPKEDEAASEAKKKEADDAMKKLKDAAAKVASSDANRQREPGDREQGVSAALLSTCSGMPGDHHAPQHAAVAGAVKAVASGLNSIVRGLSAAGGAAATSASQLADIRYTDALLAGLEPPGRNRGEPRPQRRVPDLESVVMDDGQSRHDRVIPASGLGGARAPASVEECLKALCAIISDPGTPPQSAWTFGPISIVTHSCYNSGSPILIVTYSDGGRRAYPPIVSGITALSEALLAAGASFPSDLNEDEKAELLRKAPCFARPMAADEAREYQKLFSVDSEQVFLFGLQARVTTAMITALTVAVARATDQAADNLLLNQIVSYDLAVRDDDDLPGGRGQRDRLAVAQYDGDRAAGHWPAKLASQAADLIAWFCVNLQTESFATFARSGVWKAILTSLVAEDTLHRLPFLAPFHSDPAIYMFDYFRFGAGNMSRVTGDPNVIRFKPALRTGLMDCEFISGAASPAHPWAVHKFLPGQFHSYLCVGLNSELEGLLIFPGGFGLRFDLGETLDEVWDKNLDRAVLDRYSRLANISGGPPRADRGADCAIADVGCAYPYLKSAPRAPSDFSTTSTSGHESVTILY